MQRRRWVGQLSLWLCSFLAATFASAQVATAWPDGWLALPPGNETVFNLEDDPTGDGTQLHLHTDNDAGSLLIDIAYLLTERTTLRWNWRVDELPSTRAEDTEQTHDYLAIAVMFDNGQVMSYIWSAVLPAGTTFQCPLPRWADRETHLVLYSGPAELGLWLSEERLLLEDYRRFKTGASPTAIQQVWFIAGSRLQGGRGAATFARVSLENGDDNRLELFDERGISPLDRKLSAVNATLPGAWLGRSQTLNRTDDTLQEQEFAVSYTTISRDRLDYAYWTERGLTLSEYQGDGLYKLRQWPFAGDPVDIEYHVVDVDAPDAEGNWTVHELVSYPDGSGGTIEWPQVWSLQEGELSVVRGDPPSDLPADLPWLQEYRLQRKAREGEVGR